MGDACRLTPDYMVMFEHGCQTPLWLWYLLAGQEDILIGLVGKKLKEGKSQPQWAESRQIVRTLAGFLGR